MPFPTSYSTGTATVAAGSATVFGQGTLWSGKIRAGDLFGNGDGLLIRIIAVVSDTELTLAFPWPGASRAASAYEIQITLDAIGAQQQTRLLLEQLDNGGIEYEAAFGASAAILRKVGEKLNAAWPSPSDIGHSPDATASYNDDAFNTAVVAMQSGEYGGILHLERGRFPHSTTLQFPKIVGKDLILEGQGEATQLYFSTTAAMDAIYCGSGTVGGGSGWLLKNFKIKGTTGSNLNGIYLENANNTEIERVSFDGVLHGATLYNSFGCAFILNHALSLGGTPIRALTRAHGTVLFRNKMHNCLGYWLDFQDALPSIAVSVISNDVEVCGGMIRAPGGFNGLLYTGNYMEQASAKIFDFGAPVYGNIAGANTFQMSVPTEIDYFLGAFFGNHLFDQAITWGPNSFPTAVSGNAIAGTSALQEKPKRLLTLNAAYATQANYEVPSFHSDANGVVHLQGNCTPSSGVPTLPQTLGTLPVGFRPAMSQTFTTVGTSNGVARIRVTSNGDVIVDNNGASTGQVGLGGVSFVANI